MKKRLSFIVAFILIFTMVLSGCSADTMSYFSEMEKVNDWQSSDIDIKGKVVLEAYDQKISIDIDTKASHNNSKLQAMMDLNIATNVDYTGLKYSENSTKYKSPNMIFYLDQNKFYFNKESLFSYVEYSETIPVEWENIKEEYIVVDLSESQEFANLYENILYYKNGNKIVYDKLKNVFDNYNTKFDITKAGRDYTIKLNSDQMVDELSNFVEFCEKHSNSINKFLQEYYDYNLEYENSVFNIPFEIDDYDKEFYNSDEYKYSLKDMKELIKGSTIEINSSFSDDKYIHKLLMNFKQEDNIKISIELKIEGKKTNEDNKIVMPKSVQKRTIDEINFLLYPYYDEYDEYDEYDDYDDYDDYNDGDYDDDYSTERVVIDIENNTITGGSLNFKYNEEPINIIEIYGIKYIPFKETMNALGYSVGYNAETNTVYFKDIYNENFEVDLLRMDGASYINVEQLSALDFYVYEEGNFIIIMNW